MVDQMGVSLPPLSTFVLEKILKDDSHEKKIVALGHFECNKEKQALLIFEKSPFRSLNQEAFSLFSSLSQTFQNDIYSTFSTTLPPNPISLCTIYPCTPKHISKHLPQPLLHHLEPLSLYLSTTLPYILSRPSHQTSWVKNIVDGVAETERVIYRDEDQNTGYVVTVDLKWDQKRVEDLYCVSLVMNPELRSIRDLGEKDLGLLKKLEGVRGMLAKKYNVDESKIRAFFHYQPTYYWLHVHYTHVDRHVERKELGKAVFLNDVIQNISLVPDYYQKVTLEFVLGEAHPLSVLLSKEKENREEERKRKKEGEGKE